MYLHVSIARMGREVTADASLTLEFLSYHHPTKISRNGHLEILSPDSDSLLIKNRWYYFSLSIWKNED